VTRTGTAVTVNSSSGADATIAAADASNAGVMTAADRATLNGLGSASTKSVPASGNAASAQVVLGSDTRLSDARSPTAHASSHALGGSDPIAAFTGASSGAAGAPGVVPAPSAGFQAKFLRGDATWADAPSGGSASDMTGASASAAGAHGLVIAPAAGQQNLFFKGDGTWDDPGKVLSHFSLRDTSISGFTGAKYEFLQVAGQSNDISGSVSHHAFSMVSGEVQLVRIDWIMALPDFSKTAAGQASAAYKKVGSSVSRLSQGTAVVGDVMRDSAASSLGLFLSLLTAGAYDINITSDSTSNTYNWFATVRILRMQTNV
jgi:hypothetical protein